MARARNIKPGLFENEELAELGPFDRLLFIGLWTLADREGRLEDRPKRIKMKLFPGDDYDVDEGLAALAEKGFVIRYEVEGYAVVEVANFLKHQKPHGTEKDSVLPNSNGFLTVNERGKGGCVTGAKQLVHVNAGPDTEENNVNPTLENSSTNVDPLSDNALILRFTDSLNPEEEKEPLGVSGETPPAPANQPGEKLAKYSADFELFWREYPKRHRASPKPDAWKAWQARIRAGVPSSDLIAAAIAYRKEQVALGKDGTQYVQQPATFLGPGERWTPYLGPQPDAQPAAQQSAVLSVPTHSQEMYPDDKF
ncbi:hypothetical protein [Pseudomonas nicosulfuronedens]